MAPFAGGALTAMALEPLVDPDPTRGQLIGVGLGTVIPILAALFLPWGRLPSWVEVIPPIGYLVAVMAFEGNFGGADQGFDALIVIPILWVALYGARRAELILVLACSLAALVAPDIVVWEATRTSEVILDAVLWLVIGLAGIVVYGLVEQISQRADETRLVIDSARDAFVAIDRSGMITEWSPRAEQVFGWRRDEVVGRELASTLVPDDLRERYRAELPRALAGTAEWAKGRQFEFEAIDRAGARMPVDITVSVSPWGGQPQVNIFLRNISRRKRLEHEREVLLERERAAREILEMQNTRLAELDTLRNEFVSLTSHELRTPLHSILGYCELLLEGGDLEQSQVARLQVIHRNAARLMRLANDLLVVAQAASGTELTLTTAATRLDQVAADAVEAARPAADERDIRLECTTVPVLLERGDAARLGQVVDNLVSNAIKFSPRRSQIRVTVGVSDGKAVLEVDDDGSGLDADAVGRAFDRFYRAPDAVTQGVPGSGLGLTVVKRIVDAHDGTIAMTSTPGVGTTVRVVLPLAGAAAYSESD